MEPVQESLTQATPIEGPSNPVPAKPKKRRRAPSLFTGGMYFGAKDQEFMEWLAAFGWLNINDLARLMGTTKAAAQKRADRLAAHRITQKGAGYDGRILHWATAKGLNLAGLEGFRADIKPSTRLMEHTKAMVGGLLLLRDLYPTQPVMTEREYFAVSKSGVFPARLMDGNPWLAEYGTNLERWHPPFPGGSGNSRKQPDLLMLRQDKNGQTAPPIPVEVELTLKGSINTYKRWLLAYADAAADGDLAPGVLFLVDEASDMERDIRRVLKRLDKENLDPISGKTPWHRLSIRVEALGDYFIGYRRACGIYVPPAGDST